jgi:hypothetical protein
VTTAFPGDIDDFSNPASPTTTPLGTDNTTRNHSEQHTDVNDAVEALEAVIVGPTFTNPIAQTAVLVETVINDATAGSINPGTWFVNGNLDAPSYVTTFGRNSRQNGTLKVGFAESPDPNQYSYSGINLTTPVAVGSNGALSVWMAWDTQTAGSTFRNTTSRLPLEVFELVVSDGATFTGNVVTAKLGSMTNKQQFYQHFIQLYDITSIKCIGVRQIASAPHPNGFESKKILQSTMSFATASELEVARARPGAAVMIPPTYIESTADHLLPKPPDQGVIDLRRVATAGRVRHFSDWEDAVNDGSVDMSATIQRAIRHLRDGETLMFERDAKYNCGLGGITCYNKRNVTIDFNGATFYTTGEIGTLWSVQHCVGLRFVSSGRKARMIFKHDNYGVGAINGSAFTGGAAVGTTRTLTTQGTAIQSPDAAWFGEDEDGYISCDFTLSDTAAVAGDCYIELMQSDAPAQLTGAVIGTSGGIAAGTYYYRMSYVDVEGHESGLGPPTAVTLSGWGQVTFNLPVPNTLGYATPIMFKRIYRSTTFSQQGMLDPILSVPADWTTFTDNSAASYGNPPLSLTLPAVTDAGAGNITPGGYTWFVTQIDSSGRETMIEQNSPATGTLGCRSGTTTGSMTITLPSWTGVSRMRVYRSTSAGGQTSAWKARFVGEPTALAATFLDNVATPNPKLNPPLWNDISDAPRVGPSPACPETKLTLTTSPVTYQIKLPANYRTHDDLMFWRIYKVTGTANTITLHSYTNHTAQTRQGNSQSYGGTDRRDTQHAFSFAGEGCYDCHVENVYICKPLGDGFFFQPGSGGMNNRGFTVTDCEVYANGRQGLAMMAGGDWTVKDSLFVGGGGQFIDIEVENGDRDTVTLDNVEVRQPKSSFINTPASSAPNWTIKRCKFRQIYSAGGTHSGNSLATTFNLESRHLSIEDCDFSFLPVTLLTGDVYVNGLRCAAFVSSNGQYRAFATGGEAWDGEGAFITNVHLTPRANTGPVFTVGQRTRFVSNISTTYVYDAFIDQASSASHGGPFQLAATANPFVQFDNTSGQARAHRGTAAEAILDPGPWKLRYPKTWRGTIAGNLHFPTGLDLLTETAFNVRGISSSSVRANNLRVGPVAVTAGLTTLTVPFPAKAYADLTSLGVSGASTTGGTMTAGTYYYRVAARNAAGGPRATAAAEASYTITTGNSMTIVMGNFIGSTDTFIEGWTVYRGTASGVYTQRYDVFPVAPAFSNNTDASGIRNAVDLGTTITTPGDSVGYPLSPIAATPTTAYVGSTAWDGAKWIPSVDQTGWEADTNYTALVDASWPTTVGVTKLVSGVTLTFGVACPVGGGTVSIAIVR